MKHILDYELLQEWGFEWAGKNSEDYVVLYMLADKFYSDANYFKPVMIQLVPHPLFNYQWMLSRQIMSQNLNFIIKILVFA